jgi:hypothetical protein
MLIMEAVGQNSCQIGVPSVTNALTTSASSTWALTIFCGNTTSATTHPKITKVSPSSYHSTNTCIGTMHRCWGVVLNPITIENVEFNPIVTRRLRSNLVVDNHGWLWTPNITFKSTCVARWNHIVIQSTNYS